MKSKVLKQALKKDAIPKREDTISRISDATIASVSRSILNEQDVAFSIRDKELKPVYANSACLRLFGLTYEEWERENWSAHFSPEEIYSIYNDALPEVFSGNKWRGEFELVTLKGGKRQVVAEWDTIEDERGDTFYYALYSDVTHLKSLETELRKQNDFLNAIIDTLPDPILVKDKDHIWLAVNKAFCELIGRNREELVGKSDSDYLPKNETEFFWKCDNEAMHSDKGIAYEANLTNSKGETRLISSKKVAITRFDGEKVLIAIARDITNERKLEKTIADSYRQLEAGVATLKSDLNGIQADISSGVSKAEAVHGLLQRSNRDFSSLINETRLEATPVKKESFISVPLSSREYQVFMLLVRGYRVKDAAKHLGITPNTASTYRSRILKKLGLTSITDMVQYAMRVGLI